MNKYNDGTGKWHSQTMAKFALMSSDSLIYVLDDCRRAIYAMPSNKKCEQYTDEIHYARMELTKRGSDPLADDNWDVDLPR